MSDETKTIWADDSAPGADATVQRWRWADDEHTAIVVEQSADGGETWTPVPGDGTGRDR